MPVRSLVVVALAALVTSCSMLGGSCPSIAHAGLSVTVIDSRTRGVLCDVSIDVFEAETGAHVERLDILNRSECTYQGLIERRGHFNLVIEHTGYWPVTRDVRIERGDEECESVEHQELTVPLEPGS